MAQFTAYANDNAASRKRVPYLLDLQSDLIDGLGSRLVAPLIRTDRAMPIIDRLMPTLVVDGEPVVMDTAQIASVPQRVIGKQVDDLSADRAVILAALDLLISGI